jgi:ATP/maltotriose-dependent transcriptional regulator MalT
METGAVDSFVTTYRAYPAILNGFCQSGQYRSSVAAILVLAHDSKLAVALRLLDEETDRAPLTRREREIYELLCQGLSNKEIARVLFISESTAKLHVHHIYEKLEVRSRAQAIAKRLQ